MHTNSMVAGAPYVPVMLAGGGGDSDTEDDHADIDPQFFFATDPIRRALAARGGSAVRVGDVLGIKRAALETSLERLVQCGLARVRRQNAMSSGGVYTLTREGHESLRWAGPPKPPGISSFAWAAELVKAIAQFYGVDVADVLRGSRPGPSTVARARFSYALWAKGWSTDRIDERFGMPSGWAERGVARWQRMRERTSLKSARKGRA